MEKSKVNSLQVLSLFIMIVGGPITGMNLTYIFNTAGVDSYLCPLIAAIMGIPLLFIFKCIFDYKPELTLGQKVNYIFGKHMGCIINLLLISMAVIFSMTMYFNLSDFIVSQFLPETPTKIIGIVFGIAIIYLNFKGIETISRVGLILFVMTFILFLITEFGLYQTFDVSNIKPFLEFGISNPIKGAVHMLCVNYFPIFLLLTIPKKQITDGEKLVKGLSITYAISAILVFIIIFFMMGNLGIDLAKFYQYPEYIVLKRISLFNFLDRIENILSLQRLLKMFVYLVVLAFFISNTLKPHNKSKFISIITVAFLFLLAHNSFSNNTQFNTFVVNYISLFRTIFLGLIIIILIGSKIKKNKY